MTAPAVAAVACGRPDRHASYAAPDGACVICASVAEAPQLSAGQAQALAAIWRPAVQRYLGRDPDEEAAA